MSIAPCNGEPLRSFRTLIGFYVAGLNAIKVLTDLENYGNPFFYRHAGPKGPEEEARHVLRRTLLLQILLHICR